MIRWLRFRRHARAQDDRRQHDAWRRLWREAAEAPDRAPLEDLRMRLDRMARTQAADAWEIEREMMDGLDALVGLAGRIGEAGLPVIETGHKAAGTDVCHMTAKVSLPDDSAHPAGTLLVTSTRLVFVGGARGVTLPWHALATCVRQDRDLVLSCTDRQEAYRIRCNSYADALRAAFLVGRLSRPEP